MSPGETLSLFGAIASLKGQMLLLPGQMLIDKSSLRRKSQNSSTQLPETLWSACPHSSAAPTRRTRALSSSKPFLGRKGWKIGLCDLLDTCLHGRPCSPTDFMTPRRPPTSKFYIFECLKNKFGWEMKGLGIISMSSFVLLQILLLTFYKYF